jgi:hypothetical protein
VVGFATNLARGLIGTTERKARLRRGRQQWKSLVSARIIEGLGRARP